MVAERVGAGASYLPQELRHAPGAAAGQSPAIAEQESAVVSEQPLGVLVPVADVVGRALGGPERARRRPAVAPERGANVGVEAHDDLGLGPRRATELLGHVRYEAEPRLGPVMSPAALEAGRHWDMRFVDDDPVRDAALVPRVVEVLEQGARVRALRVWTAQGEVDDDRGEPV